MLALPNVGDRRIVRLKVDNGAGSARIEVTIAANRSEPVEFQVTGNPDVVREYLQKSREVFEGSIVWWWPVRRLWFSAGLSIISGLVLAHMFYMRLSEAGNPTELEAPWQAYWLFPMVIFFGVHNPVNGWWWHRLFPNAEFTWGGGRNRIDRLKTIRTFVLGAPFVLVLIPWLQKAVGIG